MAEKDDLFTEEEIGRLRQMLDRDEKWEWLFSGIRRVGSYLAVVIASFIFFFDTLKTWLRGLLQ